MKVYKLTLRPQTAFRTPLQADTLWGHLMWALRYTEGEKALLAFLARYRAGEPPLLISDGFPAGTLPAPMLEPARPPEPLDVAELTVQKLLSAGDKDRRFLPVAQWNTLVQALSPTTFRDALDQSRRGRSITCRERGEDKPQETAVVTRTSVDRITGSARKGRLFTAEETFYAPGRAFEVWLKLVDEPDLEARVNKWWRWVEANGFGRRKSAGQGQFTIDEPGLVPASLPQAAQPNGFVTLSSWVPRACDPADVTYKTRVKRGKLAESLALPSPWKKPLLMLAPGALARLPEGRALCEWYGGLVENMHWMDKDPVLGNVVQYGYAFPLQVHIAL